MSKDYTTLFLKVFYFTSCLYRRQSMLWNRYFGYFLKVMVIDCKFFFNTFLYPSYFWYNFETPLSVVRVYFPTLEYGLTLWFALVKRMFGWKSNHGPQSSYFHLEPGHCQCKSRKSYWVMRDDVEKTLIITDKEIIEWPRSVWQTCYTVLKLLELAAQHRVDHRLMSELSQEEKNKPGDLWIHEH